jgi:hypothetical protein
MSDVWKELRPNRVRVLHTYAKRGMRWRRNSSPYLSGDLFSDESDVSLYPPRFRGKQTKLKDIREARVLFCPSDKLQEFFDEFHKYIAARVIICGNSDYEFRALPSNVPKSVRQMFLQNSFISQHQLVSSLPIGVENLRWGVNGNPKHLKPGKNWLQRQNEILIGPFGLTHPTRIEIKNTFLNHVEGIRLMQDRLKPADYANISNKIRYVAAVRGNGVDTHRLWETLYRGGVPLIMRDDWSAGMKRFGFPFLEVTNWSAQNLTSILQINEDLSFAPNQIPALWWPYWKKLISSYL